MRSRYTAFTVEDYAYIKNTIAPESRKGLDIEQLKQAVAKTKWKGLEILATDKGGIADVTGMVEFNAKYEYETEIVVHHEVATFRKDEEGQWLFVKGKSEERREGDDTPIVHQETVKREGPKIGRNDPCSCGSGKKFKKCCG